MSQQALEIGDNVIIKSKKELLEFYEKLKGVEDWIDEETINDWFKRTLDFKGKVIKITGKNCRHGIQERTLYYGKHKAMVYSFYKEELIKIDTPRNK